MENQGAEPVVVATDLRAAYAAHDPEHAATPELRELDSLRYPVGTKLADARALDDLRNAAEVRRKQDACRGVTRCESEDPVQPPECLSCAGVGDGL